MSKLPVRSRQSLFVLGVLGLLVAPIAHAQQDAAADDAAAAPDAVSGADAAAPADAAQADAIPDAGRDYLWPDVVSRLPEAGAMGLSIKVNFQCSINTGSCAGAMAMPPPVPGYLIDIGQEFGDRGNGYFYGWNGDNTMTGRYRMNDLSPDIRYDTFVHMQKQDGTGPADAAWEIAVPNGMYYVHIVSGDATAMDSVFKLMVEDKLVVNGIPDMNTSLFVEGYAMVEVKDQRLTVSSGEGAMNNKINFIEISTRMVTDAGLLPKPDVPPTPDMAPMMMTPDAPVAVDAPAGGSGGSSGTGGTGGSTTARDAAATDAPTSGGQDGGGSSADAKKKASSSSGGCSCELGGAAPVGAAPVPLLLAGAALVLRRRRRRG